MFKCVFCGLVSHNENARFCSECGPESPAKDWTPAEVDQGIKVSQYVSLLSDHFFDSHDVNEVEKLSVRMRERLRISYDTHVNILSKLAAQKKAVEHLSRFRFEFNEDVTDAYASHDTFLEFRYTNLSDVDSFKVSLFWDDPETTDRVDLKFEPKNFVKPQTPLVFGGSVIFDRIGTKEISDLQLTVTDQFGDTANFRVEPFRFKVGNPETRVVQHISTHNQISIEGRGVVDATGMGQYFAERQAMNNLPQWKPLSVSYIPKADLLSNLQIEPEVAEVPTKARIVKARTKPLFTEVGDSRLPQLDLLEEAPSRQEKVSAETLEMTSRLIEKKLKDFGVEVRVVAASPGPVINRYEIELATGVKGSQVVNIAKDLARSLSHLSIRVVETIPGKNYMALELPNAKRQTIRLSEVLGSDVYSEARSLLTMGLGKDIIGNPVVADLAKMPHLLVAGTKGSGKSMAINAMILSLLYKAEACDLRLLMIAPKMLEMSVFEGIPHLLAPVVTDMHQAAHCLNWCEAEMEKRYKLISKVGERDLAGYNAKIDEATARQEFIYNPFSLTPEQPEPLLRLPNIVVVIDELADLMMVVGKKIEELIARLAQKASAAGIHLILVTQRPNLDVITDRIKANIPTRIAFSMGSQSESRTFLDQIGAEALLGMGDMLYMENGTGFAARVHGAFVSNEEVHRVVSYLKSQGEPDYIEGILVGGTVNWDGNVSGSDMLGEDPMYDQAVEVVLKNRKASISLVQRHLKIGYNRAARLVEDMEKAGLVSAIASNGQREILLHKAQATAADELSDGDEHLNSAPKDGQGAWQYDGYSYVGSYKDGLFHGWGEINWTGENLGHKYAGNFENGYRHGQGTYTFPSGETQVGTFENNEFIPRHHVNENGQPNSVDEVVLYYANNKITALGTNFYVNNGPKFHKKIENFAQSFSKVHYQSFDPNTDVPLLFYDGTILGSGKDGIVFTANGIYAKGCLGNSAKHVNISYGQIKSVRMSAEGVRDKEIFLESSGHASLVVFNPIYAPLEDLFLIVEMLKKIQDFLRR